MAVFDLRVWLICGLIWAGLIWAAFGQQIDPAKMVPALQGQRNSAMDGWAVCDGMYRDIFAERDKLVAKVKELEAKIEPKVEPKNKGE